MYKLYIWQIFDPKAKMPEALAKIQDEFETSSQAELRALRWLMFRPMDIIMLEEPQDPNVSQTMVGRGIFPSSTIRSVLGAHRKEDE